MTEMNKKAKSIKLGVTWMDGGANFAMQIPEGKEASLLLYEVGAKEPKEIIVLDDASQMGNVRAVFVPQIQSGQYEYNYKVDQDYVLDPYGVLIKDQRALAVDLSKNGKLFSEKQGISYEELILYKLHVRGFTMQENAKIKNKGTFQALIQKIPYLKSLGVNAVEFMPMYHWDDTLKMQSMSNSYKYKEEGTPLKNYWGYAPVNYYFAPKEQFAATENPVQECSEMIQAFHQAGIECIMEIYFPAGTSPALARQVALFWKIVYGVDGFHFIGAGVPMEVLAKEPLLTRTRMMFDRVDDNWIYGRELPKVRNLAEYNDDFMHTGRQFLKGDENQVAAFTGFSRKNPNGHGVINYMAGINGFTLHDMVSYDRKHNEDNGEDNRDGSDLNFSWNCGVEGPTRKQGIRMMRRRQIKNALLYIMLAQGTPMLLQGDERGNSQLGNNNAYAMDNEIGWVDWKNSADSKELLEFTREAIAFRKAHPILHASKEMRMMDYRTLGYPDLSYHDERAWYSEFAYSSRSVGLMYCGAYADDHKEMADDFIYIAYNTHWEPHDFAMPNLPAGKHWYKAVDTGLTSNSFLEKLEKLTDQKTMEVAARTVVVLLGK